MRNLNRMILQKTGRQKELNILRCKQETQKVCMDNSSVRLRPPAPASLSINQINRRTDAAFIGDRLPSPQTSRLAEISADA
jgi:hypothetical protein